MSTKRIPVHKLTVGMFAEELDRPWLDTPFFFHKKKIKRQEDIDEFIRYGIKTVLINTDKGLDCKDESILNQHERAHLVDTPKAPQLPPSKPQDSDPVVLNEELPRAKEIKTNVTNAVKNVFNDVRMGKAIEINEVKAQVNTIVDSVFRNRDALLCLANLKDYDDYTFLHSVNVGILAVSFGRHLGLSKTQLESIGLGGLLHDIGKTQIPESILNKPGKFSEDEYTIMKRHVSLGVEILNKHDHIPQEAALVTSQHHERFNGTGYPQRLCGDKISLFGQIASMADVYEAMTYDRVYRKATSCHTTLKRLYEWSDTLFNRSLMEMFIQCIGIYPYGTFVELNTGHCGIVVSVNHEALLRPNVLILFDKDKKPQNPLLLELAKERDSGGNFLYSIQSELDPAAWEVDINQYVYDRQYVHDKKLCETPSTSL